MAPNWRAVLVQQWLRGLSKCMVMDRPSLQDNLRWVNYQFSEIVSDTKTGWVVLISQNARLSSPVYTHSLMRITMRVNRASVCIYDYGHALFSPFDHILSQIHAPSHSSHYIQPHRRTCLHASGFQNENGVFETGAMGMPHVDCNRFPQWDRAVPHKLIHLINFNQLSPCRSESSAC